MQPSHDFQAKKQERMQSVRISTTAASLDERVLSDIDSDSLGSLEMTSSSRYNPSTQTDLMDTTLDNTDMDDDADTLSGSFYSRMGPENTDRERFSHIGNGLAVHSDVPNPTVHMDKLRPANEIFGIERQARTLDNAKSLRDSISDSEVSLSRRGQGFIRSRKKSNSIASRPQGGNMRKSSDRTSVSSSGRVRRRRKRRSQLRSRERSSFHDGNTTDSITSLSDTDSDDGIASTFQRRRAVSAASIAAATAMPALEAALESKVATIGGTIETPNMRTDDGDTPESITESIDLERHTAEFHNFRNAMRRLDGKVNISPFLRKGGKDTSDSQRKSGAHGTTKTTITASNHIDDNDVLTISLDSSKQMGKIGRELTGREMSETANSFKNEMQRANIHLAQDSSLILNDTEDIDGSFTREAERSRFKRKIRDLEATIASLKGELKVYRIREKNLAVSYNNEAMLVAQTTDQLNNTRLEKEQLQRTIQQLTDRINSLTHQLNDAENELKFVQNRGTEDTRRASDLEQEIKKLQLQNREIRETKEGYERLVREIKKNEKSLLGRLDEMQKKIIELENGNQDNRELAEQLTRSKKVEDDLLHSLQQEQKQVSILKQDQLQLRSQLNMKTAELEDVAQRLELMQAAKTDSDQLLQDKMDLENQVRQSAARESDLLQQLKDSQRKINKLTEINNGRNTVVEQEFTKKLQHMQKLNEELEETCRQLKSKNHTTQEKHQYALDERKLLNDEMVELQSRMQVLRRENTALLEENSSLKKRTQEQAHEFQTFDEEFQTIKSRYRDFLKKYDALMRAHNEVKTVLKEREDKLYQYVEKIKRLKSENASIHSQLQLLREDDMTQYHHRRLHDDSCAHPLSPQPASITKTSTTRQNHTHAKSRRQTVRRGSGADAFLSDNRELPGEAPIQSISVHKGNILDADDLSPLQVRNGGRSGSASRQRSGSSQKSGNNSRQSRRLKQEAENSNTRGLKLEDIDRLEEENNKFFAGASRRKDSRREDVKAVEESALSKFKREFAERGLHETHSRKERHKRKEYKDFEGYGEDEVIFDYDSGAMRTSTGTPITQCKYVAVGSDPEIKDVRRRNREQLEKLEEEFSRIEDNLGSKEREYLRRKLMSYRTKLELKNIQLTSLKELMLQYMNRRAKAKAVAKARAKAKAKQDLYDKL